MKVRILFVERKQSAAVSIEKVFRQIARSISKEKFVTNFQQLKYSNDALGTIKNLFFFTKSKADIYHITGHIHYMALVLPKKNTILTVHDVGILHIRKSLRRYILKKLLFDFPIKRLNYITAVSEATKKDVVFYTKCDESKIRVIENPIQDHFNPAEEKIFNREEPVLLQIGTAANKNLLNLITALEGIKCLLKIIGHLDSAIIDLLNEKKINYENILNLDDKAIRKEYAEADIITFCSIFEGFGLPIIEAQAMLTPVITSNLSPMKEVAGEGAALADPHDAESIKKEILKIIKDESYRKNLIIKGTENVKKYRPEKIVGLYENLYHEVFANSR